MENDASSLPSQTSPPQPPPPMIPGYPPPRITPPPPPRPPRQGSGWMKAAIVLGILLGVSVLANLRHVIPGVTVRAKSGRQARARLEEAMFENNHSKNKIAILDVAGIITSEAWD